MTEEKDCGCQQKGTRSACCIEHVTTMDERGQVVIPKEVRNALGWKGGEKIAIITRTSNNKPCCVMLVNVGSLSTQIKGFIDNLE
nr:HgcAB-associated protein [Candidatus Sigynarchaeota archaeon]